MKQYILTMTAHRKNAKRHIAKRGTMDVLKRYSNNLNRNYRIEIYDSRWNLIETINE